MKRLAVTVLFCVFAFNLAKASTLLASASGNLTASGTWSLVDSTSYLNSEAANTALTTSSVASSTFVPAATAIDAVAVKLASKSVSPSGTITVELFNSTTSAIALTLTINVSDLPTAATADAQGGWILFKFGSTVTPNGTDSYSVRGKTSASSQVNLYSIATTNWSRALRNTTNQAPSAGDDLIIVGEKTGAGAQNALTVTMNQTATTAYGSSGTCGDVLTGSAAPALAIGQGGTLNYGVAASTNYVLRIAGCAIVYGGGTLQLGTVGGTVVPISSTAVLEFNLSGSDGDMGLICRDQSTCGGSGAPRTSGKNVVQTKLTASTVANTTATLTVADDTGWLSGDQIVVASTGRNVTDGVEQSETGTLSGNAAASTMGITGFSGTSGTTKYVHLGTSGSFAQIGVTYTWSMQAEVINVTRNVKVRSTSATIMAFVYASKLSIVSFSWTEFYYVGANLAGKRGIETDTTTGSFSATFVSLHDTKNFGMYLAASQTTWNNTTVTDFVAYNLATTLGPGFSTNSASVQTNIIFNRATVILTGNLDGIHWAAGVRGTIANITVVSAARFGFNINPGNGSLGPYDTCGTFGPLTVHSNISIGAIVRSNLFCTINGLYSWRNSATGVYADASMVDLTIDPFYSWGNNASNNNWATSGDVVYKNGIVASDTTYSTNTGLGFDSSMNVTLENMMYSSVSAPFTKHVVNDIINLFASDARVVGRNVLLNSTDVFVNMTNSMPKGYVCIDKYLGVAGSAQCFFPNGQVSSDTVIVNATSPSLRLLPSSAGSNLSGAPLYGGVKVPVTNGVPATVCVYARKSVSGDSGGSNYNGISPILVQKSSAALGIQSDSTIATLSGGAGSWAQMCGTSSIPTAAGNIEFVVQAGGVGWTTGWVNVGDWSVSGQGPSNGSFFNGSQPAIASPTGGRIIGG